MLPSRTWHGAGPLCAHIVVTLRRGANSASARSIADRRRKEKPPLPPLGGRRTCERERARSSALPMDARHPQRRPSRKGTSHPLWQVRLVEHCTRHKHAAAANLAPLGQVRLVGGADKVVLQIPICEGPHSPSAACESVVRESGSAIGASASHRASDSAAGRGPSKARSMIESVWNSNMFSAGSARLHMCAHARVRECTCGRLRIACVCARARCVGCVCARVSTRVHEYVYLCARARTAVCPCLHPLV